jgi:ZIP family zinc transporter
MILVSFAELLPDAFAAIGFGPAYLAFFGGMGFMLLVDFVIPHIYLAEDHSGGTPGHNLRRTALLVALGIGIHNFPEGMATFAGALRSTHLGLAMAAAIAAHNIPEGLAVAAPIYAATGKRGRAFLLSFLSGIAEPVGAGMAALVLAPILTPTLLAWILAAIAGVMIFISLDELVPASRAYGHAHLSIVAAMAGMAVMAASLALLHRGP